jgi:hypothetical protein
MTVNVLDDIELTIGLQIVSGVTVEMKKTEEVNDPLQSLNVKALGQQFVQQCSDSINQR